MSSLEMISRDFTFTLHPTILIEFLALHVPNNILLPMVSYNGRELLFNRRERHIRSDQ